MTRHAWTVFLTAVTIAGINLPSADGDEIALNYSKIEFELVEQTGSGISFGGSSAFDELPADFFGPGSEPFSGDVTLKGKKILQNLVVERSAGAIFDPPSAPQDIPSEVLELSLASVEPIVVTYSDGLTEEWDMTVDMEKDNKSSCWIRVAQESAGEPEGGTILPEGTYFDIFAAITLSHTPAGGSTRYRFFAIVDRTNLSTSDATWAHRHDSIAGGANRDFIPGADPDDPSAPLQVLFFEGGGLDLSLRVIDVVPEPSSLVLLALGALGWMRIRPIRSQAARGSA